MEPNIQIELQQRVLSGVQFLSTHPNSVARDWPSHVDLAQLMEFSKGREGFDLLELVFKSRRNGLATLGLSPLAAHTFGFYLEEEFFHKKRGSKILARYWLKALADWELQESLRPEPHLVQESELLRPEVRALSAP